MCEIVGGIYVIGTDQIDTVIYGGNSMTVGQHALDAMQDRALHAQGDIDVFKSLDDKKLLGFIGMSRPISFGTIDTDDGETSFIVSRKNARVVPSYLLMSELKTRLSLAGDKVAELLIKDLELNRSVWMALGDTVDRVIEQINASLKSRGKKSLDVILIAPALGQLIPFTSPPGLEVATDVKALDPKSFKELMTRLLDLAVKNKCVIPAPDSGEALPAVPEYPKLNVSLPVTGSLTRESVADYVMAIIERENELTPHLVAIEKYNVDVAQGIQRYARHIVSYLK